MEFRVVSQLLWNCEKHYCHYRGRDLPKSSSQSCGFGHLSEPGGCSLPPELDLRRGIEASPCEEAAQYFRSCLRASPTWSGGAGVKRGIVCRAPSLTPIFYSTPSVIIPPNAQKACKRKNSFFLRISICRSK